MSLFRRRNLSGARVFITGAASGIGKATAMAVAAKGGELFLTDVNGSALDATVAEIEAAGGTVRLAQAADVSSYEAVRALAAKVHDQVDAVDVVMNIAGISLWGPVELLTEQHWQRVVDVNLMGPIHVIQCLVPAMIAAGRGGHLVNVSSAAGLFGLPWHAAYSASKFGLRGLSEVLRFDLQRHRIGVSLVCPGGVDTPLVETVKIVGVDTSRPQIQALRRRFRAHAVAPAVAAAAILDGVERGRYMVYTSLDIRVGHFFQRVFPWGYEFVMRRLNDALHRVVSQ
jgi:NAD(P)-dependent dehydrogenase (short-subunit alcohol dehydrogenase family)